MAHLIRDLSAFLRYSTDHRRKVRLCRRSGGHIYSDRVWPPGSFCVRCESVT